VLVAKAGIPRGKALGPELLRSSLSQRRVPQRFVPPDALSAPEQAAGLRTVTAIAKGSYVERAQLEAAVTRGGTGRPIARQVEVPVAGTDAMRDLLRPRARVDVLVTSESDKAGAPRTYLALQSVELIGLRSSEHADQGDEGPRADAMATLRVSLRQAVLLTAAGNFARELRLVPRPAGDRRQLPATAVTAADLRP
jgi:pilus assembly protein CpaB